MTTCRISYNFFYIIWYIAIRPAKRDVIPPNKINKNNTNSEYSKIIEHLIIINTPAVTIVAACNKEDTGVGLMLI